MGYPGHGSIPAPPPLSGPYNASGRYAPSQVGTALSPVGGESASPAMEVGALGAVHGHGHGPGTDAEGVDLDLEPHAGAGPGAGADMGESVAAYVPKVSCR